MKVAILGYSTLEQSESVDAYNYYKKRGDDITIYYWEGGTASADLPKEAQTVLTLDEHTFQGLDNFDMIVRGAFVHPKDIKTTKPVTTVYNEFMALCPAPVIGVTGTKGKGTTSTLISKILLAAGKKVFLAGNIGIPPLALLPDITTNSIVILELSSFQLMDFKYSPKVGVCLMVVPEHLNWHTDMEEYLAAKSNLFINQEPSDTAVYNMFNKNSRDITARSKASRLGYAVAGNGETVPGDATAYVEGDEIFFQRQIICKVSEVALLGRHNLENVCAAIAASWTIIDGNIEAITSVVRTFTGLPHRLEMVRDLGGVKYYDDSFSTTPETAIAAVESFAAPVVMILGGSDKGIPFDELADTVATKKPKAVLTIGDTGPKIAELLRARGYESITSDGLNSMQAIVETAKAKAEPGDVVLLSTGCASFGMFKDYKDRGNQFKAAVAALPEQALNA
ncbi:UDP-N-acetylmuramoyl-L-alanine--D-glutamate ligase [soil metagenome]